MHDRPVYSDKRMKSEKDSAGSRKKNPPETVKKSARQGQKIRQIRTKNPLDTDKKSTRQIFQMLKLNENPPKHWCEYEAHEL